MPQEPTVLLKESLERATSRAAIEPDGNFVNRLSKLRLEDEKQRSGVILLINRHRPRIHFANVIINIGQLVDEVGYQDYVNCLFHEYTELTYAGFSYSESGNPPLQHDSTL